MTLRTRGLALLAAAAFLTACGGEDADPGFAAGDEGAREALSEFTVGFLDGDGPHACAFLSPDAQLRLTKEYSAPECLSAVRAAHGELDAEGKGALSAVTDADISVSGDKATVSGEDATAVARLVASSKLRLVRVEEHWVVG